MRCPNPRFVWPKGEIIAVPCGKCLACLSNKRHDWAFRLMQEYKVSRSAHFVTLTYNEKFLPDCGLVKRHLQLYLKRLRKLTPRLRYYCVGEYGSKTQRPHYHGIIFNANEEDIRRSWCFQNKKSKKWYQFGIVHLGKVSEASVSYVLKYIVQKEDWDDKTRNQPFAIMSRGYGLGLNYLSDEMVRWHREGIRNYSLKYGTKLRLARYYKDKIWPNAESVYIFRHGEVYSTTDWKGLREFVNQKVLKEAEQQEAKQTQELIEGGYDPERIRKESRELLLSRVKSKVSHTQKF